MTNDAQKLTIDTIRTLAMDSVQHANAGHPGTAMALAPLAYVLYRDVMRHNPANPDWPNRDRFVLSAGHACILQYSALHLAGYNLSLEELKRFRQWESRTPGHPEHFLTEGIETTTGPLGQGFANASSPPCSSVSRISARSRVVLPAPFGPDSASRSRRSSLNETPSKSGSPENSLRRLEAIRTATLVG